MADIDEQGLFQGTSTTNSGTSPIGRQMNPCEKRLYLTKLVIIGIGTPFVLAVLLASTFAFDDREATEFSMHLAGFQGLNATAPGHTVSPRFSLKVRADTPHAVVRPWCYGGGEAVVSYSDVALAWGQVPRFCIGKRRTAVELTVLAWGNGIGLSEDLRRRLASDWSRGTAQVKVETKLFYDDKGPSYSEKNNGAVLHSFQLMLTHDLLQV